MAAKDEGGRASRHEDEVGSLTAQISFLDEEIAVLRRRLADSPRQVRLLEERLRETEASLSSVTGQNERLASTLREARDQIIALKEEVDRLAQPPSGFGVFLAVCEDNTADVFTGGRKMRVNVSPNVDLERAPAQARKSCSTRRSTSSSPRVTRPWARSSCSRRSSPTASARWSSRTPTRSASSGWPTPLLRPATAQRRLAAARAALRLRLRAHPQGRGRGPDPGRGARTSPTTTSAA